MQAHISIMNVFIVLHYIVQFVYVLVDINYKLQCGKLEQNNIDFHDN